MGNRSKDENAAAENHSRDRDQESRDASLAKIIAEAVAQQSKSIVEAVSRQKSEETQALTDVFQRQMEETRAQYQELLKASCAQKLSSTLKVASGTNGFRVMDAFDWTNDKNIYQRWQLWSHKARLALDAMEGDNEKTKISYLHHWLDGKGIDKIKGWTNSKILIPQEEYDALEDANCFLLVFAVSGPFTSRLAVRICFSWFSRLGVCFCLGNICERFARRDLC